MKQMRVSNSKINSECRIHFYNVSISSDSKCIHNTLLHLVHYNAL